MLADFAESVTLEVGPFDNCSLQFGQFRESVHPVVPALHSGSLFGDRSGLLVVDAQQLQKAEAEVHTTASIELHNDVIRFDEQIVDIRQLRRELNMLNLHGKHGKDKVVLLEAMGKVTYQTYFDVMASISAAGGVTAIVREDDGSE